MLWPSTVTHFCYYPCTFWHKHKNSILRGQLLTWAQLWLRVYLQGTYTAQNERSSTSLPRHFHGIGQTHYSYHPEKNIRIAGVCNKYPNCFCFLKKHTYSFDLLQDKSNELSGCPSDQTCVEKSLLIIIQHYFCHRRQKIKATMLLHLTHSSHGHISGRLDLGVAEWQICL